MDYARKDKTAEQPLERIKHFNEFYTPSSERGTGTAGGAVHGVRRAVLPVRSEPDGDGQRMPAPQPCAGVERPDLQWQLGGSVLPPGEDE